MNTKVLQNRLKDALSEIETVEQQLRDMVDQLFGAKKLITSVLTELEPLRESVRELSPRPPTENVNRSDPRLRTPSESLYWFSNTVGTTDVNHFNPNEPLRPLDLNS